MTPADLFRPKTIGQVSAAWLRHRSDELLAESLQLRMDGWTDWADEVLGFAVMADRAATGEQYDPQPEGLPDERSAS